MGAGTRRWIGLTAALFMLEEMPVYSYLSEQAFPALGAGLITLVLWAAEIVRGWADPGRVFLTSDLTQ